MTSLLDVSISDRVARVTLNRPGKRNALNTAMVEDLLEVERGLGRQGVDVVELRAVGTVFSAGADLKEMGSVPLDRLVDRIRGSAAVWIACCEGPVLGGAIPVVAACPIVVATDRVSFRLPELDRGFFPSPVVGRLMGVLPIRKALLMAILGTGMSALDAERWGLVTQVVADAEFSDAVQTWVSRLLLADAVDGLRDAWQRSR